MKRIPPRERTEDTQRLEAILRRLSEYIDWDSESRPHPVDALVATILSQNTSDINSERAYRMLRSTFATWDAVADADVDGLAEVIRIGGLADQKARTITSALRALRDRYGSFDLTHFESTDDAVLLDELIAINGIGLKTASCVLMFALGRDLCAIDTHIHRVANRLGLVDTTTPDRTFHELRPQIPTGEGRNLHVALIRFGRHICKSQRPHCFECPVYDLCGWELKEEFAHTEVRGASAASGNVILPDILRHAPKPPRSRGPQ